MVVTGDLTQVDLPPRQESGLKEAKRVLGQSKVFTFMTSITEMLFAIPWLAE